MATSVSKCAQLINTAIATSSSSGVRKLVTRYDAAHTHTQQNRNAKRTEEQQQQQRQNRPRRQQKKNCDDDDDDNTP